MAVSTKRGPTARTEQLVTETIADEVLIYDLDRDEAHSLDRVASSVWRHCDGHRDVADLVAAVAADLNMRVGEDAITSAIAQLHSRHLLAGETPGEMTPPDFSRRQALLRIGATGVAAGLAIPVIKSIAAPTVAEAGSPVCAPPAGACGTYNATTQTCSGCCGAPGETCSPDTLTNGAPCHCTD